MKRIGNKILLLTNVFPKVLNLKPLIILITKMHGLTHFLSNLLSIHGFLIEEKNFKHFFQTGSKKDGFSFELFQIFFVPTYEKPLIISKPIVNFFSLMETNIHYYFVLSLGSLGLSTGTLPLIICSHLIFPNIWPENLKSNGGPPSKFLEPKHLNQSKIGLILKNSNLQNLQKKLMFGPRPCLNLFLASNSLQNLFSFKLCLRSLFKKGSRTSC